ncbi:MAG TPA: hypothetical protein VM712_13325 [Gaiellales bacterium]|nr:hypothetical protein [Gaiellales bacterium]
MEGLRQDQRRRRRFGRRGRGRGRPLQEELVGPVPALLARCRWHAGSPDAQGALLPLPHAALRGE